MEDLSYKTAITRKKLSVPMKYLNDKGLIQGRVLDYGCGKGSDAQKLGMDKYDPHFFPKFRKNAPIGGYDVVVCNYVLNVLENPHDRGNVERRVMSFTKPGGISFITVRNDKKFLKGRTSKGTWQGLVQPVEEGWELIKETTKYRIYMYCKPVLEKGKSLDEYFSRADIEYLVLHATGKNRAIREVMVYTYDFDEIREKAKTSTPAAIWLADHSSDHEMIIGLDDYYDLIVTGDGAVIWKNHGGCSLDLRNPLPCYEMVLRRIRPGIFKN